MWRVFLWEEERVVVAAVVCVFCCCDIYGSYDLWLKFNGPVCVLGFFFSSPTYHIVRARQTHDDGLNN